MKRELIDIIKDRRSVRAFTDQDVDIDIIEMLIEAAQWAPSSSNKQLWDFIIVRDKKWKREVVQKSKAHKFLAQAPVVIFVCYSRKFSTHHANIQTASAAIQNMLLLGEDLGLASVWVEACGKREILHDMLDIPKDLYIISSVLFGYPAKDPKPPPRRNIKEIMHFEKFEYKKGWDRSKRVENFKDWTQFSLEDYRARGVRATSPTEDLFENLSTIDAFNQEVSYVVDRIKDSDKILDFLTYVGNHILEIKKITNNKNIYVHDVADDLFDFLLGRKEALSIDGNVKFLKGKLFEVPVEDKYFNIITCFNKINMIPDFRPALLEIKRILKDDGVFILTAINGHILKSTLSLNFKPLFKGYEQWYATNEGPYVPLSFSQIKNILHDSGFEIIDFYGVSLGSKNYPFITKSGSTYIHRFSKKLCFACKKII